MEKIKKFGLSLLKESYYVQADLIRRGWKLREIQAELPKPILYQNPINSGFAPIKTWKKSIVHKKEKIRKGESKK